MTRFLLLSLLLLVGPAVAGALVEVPVSDGPVLAPSYEERMPAVVGDGRGLLVAWIGDRRRQGFCAFASRLTPDGTNLDPVGIVLDCGVSSHVRPAVALSADHALVVYVVQGLVRVVTIDRGDGRIVSRTDVYDSNFRSSDIAPRAAWNGTHFLVTWNEPVLGRGRRFTGDGAAGQPFDFTGTLLGLTVRGGDFFAVTVDGTQPCPGLCALVHQLERLGRTDATPQVASTFVATVRRARAVTHDLATNGSGFLFAWVNPEGSGAPGGEMKFVTLDASGAKTAETTLAHATDDAPVSVLWTGSEYLFAYTAAGGVYVQRHGGQPQRVGSGWGALARTAARVFVAHGGYHSFERPQGGGALRGRFLDETRQRALAMRIGAQDKPRMATNGDDVFVVWRESFEAKASLFRGTTRVKRIDLGHTFGAPDVAFDGRHYLVVYDGEGDGILARMFDVDGNAVGGEIALPRFGAGFDSHARVAAGRDGFLVVWHTSVIGSLRIAALAIGPDGIPRQRPSNVTPESDQHRFPAVTAMGDDYLVASTVYDESLQRTAGIRISRVTRDGLLLHSTFIDSPNAHDAEIAAGDGDAVVVWQQNATVLARIGPQLVLEPPRRVSAGLGSDVAWDGSAYRIVTGVSQLRGLTLRANDAIEDFAISNGRDEFPRDQAIAIVQGRPVVAFQRGVAEPNATGRVFLRWASPEGRRRP